MPVSIIMTLNNSLVIFGGSFDPPHVGHQAICLWLKESLGAKEIIVVPTYKHCLGKQLTDFTHRLEMCKLMTANLDCVRASAVEMQLPQPNYTVNLVKFFRKEYDNVAVVIGGDNLSQLDSWEKWEEIPKLAKIVACGRPGYNGKTDFPNVYFYPVGISTVSSTEVRNRITNKQSLVGFVPKTVKDYIDEHDLYT